MKRKPHYRLMKGRPVLIGHRDQASGELVSHARDLASHFPGDKMDGHFILAWDSEGAYSTGWSAGGKIGPRLAASLIKVIADEIPLKSSIHDVVGEMFD